MAQHKEADKMRKCKTMRIGQKCDTCWKEVNKENYRGWYRIGKRVFCPKCHGKPVPIWVEIFHD